MNDREAEDCAELVAELARLEGENARLRSLLGLDDRSAYGHATARSPMPLPEVVSSAAVDSSSSKSEKLFLASVRSDHTHATILLKAGVHVKVVSERLGHANIAFTMTVYQHVIPGMQADAARMFSEAVYGAAGDRA